MIHTRTRTGGPTRGSARRVTAGVLVASLLGAGLTTLGTINAVAAPTGDGSGNGTLTVTSGVATSGGLITIKGTGFDVRGAYAIKFNDGAHTAPDQTGSDGEWQAAGYVLVTDSTNMPDENGDFEVTVRVPAGLADSTSDEDYWVRLLGGSMDDASYPTTVSKYAFYTVGTVNSTQATAVSTATDGTVTVTIQGTDYAAGADLSVEYGGEAAKWTVNRVEADTISVAEDGTFTGSVVLAAGAAPAGKHTITVKSSDAGDEDAEVEFTSTAAVSVSASPAINSSIAVTAVNLPASATVTSFGAVSNWISEDVVATEADVATFQATVPATEKSGSAISLGYAAGSQPTTFKTSLVVTPDDTRVGAYDFEVVEKALNGGLYQVAVNSTTSKVFTAAAVGRPPITDSTLTKLDADTLAVEQTVIPGAVDAGDASKGVYGVYGIGLDNSREEIWVTNTRQNTVAVYSQDDLSLVKQFTDGAVSHSRDVVIDEQEGKAYVSSANRSGSKEVSTVEVFDTETKTQLDPITLGDAEHLFAVTMSLDLDPATGKLYTVSMTYPTAAVIDTRNNNEVTYYDLGEVGSASGVAYAAGSNRLFVASQATNNVVVLDLASGEIVADIPTGVGALNAAYDQVNNLVYVSNRTSGTVTVIDADTLQKVANLDGGTNPNHLEAAANGVVYAVNKATSNVIQKIVPVPVNLVRPAITGTAKVGQTLTVSTGSWARATGAQTTVTWYRDGARIKGVTDLAYVLTAADAGKAIQAKVTVSLAGASETATSKEVTVAKASTKTKASFDSATKKKGKKGTATVTVTATGTTPTGTVQVYNGSKRIGSGTLSNGTATVKLSALKKGTRTLTVKYLGSSAFASSSAKYKVKVK